MAKNAETPLPPEMKDLLTKGLFESSLSLVDSIVQERNATGQDFVELIADNRIWILPERVTDASCLDAEVLEFEEDDINVLCQRVHFMQDAQGKVVTIWYEEDYITPHGIRSCSYTNSVDAVMEIYKFLDKLEDDFRTIGEENKSA